MIKNFQKMTKKHRAYFSENWNEESLWTVYALQDGISRKRHKRKDPDRGSGTIRLIESFKSIASNHIEHLPVMSITSGHVNICFDEDARLEEKEYGKFKRKVIAFNKENNLALPAEKKNVRILNNFFPGTVISMKFYIGNEYIDRSNGGERNDN
jgi:hypothetical protein